MAKKKQALDAKLGSWTDQAGLSRTQAAGRRACCHGAIR